MVLTAISGFLSLGIRVVFVFPLLIYKAGLPPLSNIPLSLLPTLSSNNAGNTV